VEVPRVLTNAGARVRDVLLLTKPIGTGIIGTAIKFGRAPQATADRAIASMITLNRHAAEALRRLRPGAVHACTDVTGYGLIGHASEMAAASGVTIAVDVAAVPLFDGVANLVRRNRTGGGDTNQSHFGPAVENVSRADADVLTLLYDPQTSGGLLVAVDPAAADEAVRILKDAQVAAAVVGEVLPAGRARLVLR
jgi:selenide,water dikinase